MKDKINGGILKRGEVGWGRHSIEWGTSLTSCIFHFFLGVKSSLLKQWQSEWDAHVCTPLCSLLTRGNVQEVMHEPADIDHEGAVTLLETLSRYLNLNVSSDKLRASPSGSSPSSTPFSSVQTVWLHQSASRSLALSYSYSGVIEGNLPFLVEYRSLRQGSWSLTHQVQTGLQTAAVCSGGPGTIHNQTDLHHRQSEAAKLDTPLLLKFCPWKPQIQLVSTLRVKRPIEHILKKNRLITHSS